MTVIRAVLFDLGDTLWHFPGFPPRDALLARMAERITAVLSGWGLCDGVNCGRLAREYQEADWRETSAAYASHCRSPNFPALLQEIARGHGVNLTDDQSRELWHATSTGGAFLGREVFPDSIPTLRWLKSRGYRLGAVTNRSVGGPPFLEELHSCGMDTLFETCAVSCDHGWLKPAPELFHRALNDLNVLPNEAVMVGDSLRADVAGARALGMTAVWKRPPKPVAEDARLPDGTLVEPDFVIDHPGELQLLPLFAV